MSRLERSSPPVSQTQSVTVSPRRTASSTTASEPAGRASVPTSRTVASSAPGSSGTTRESNPRVPAASSPATGSCPGVDGRSGRASTHSARESPPGSSPDHCCSAACTTSGDPAANRSSGTLPARLMYATRSCSTGSSRRSGNVSHHRRERSAMSWMRPTAGRRASAYAVSAASRSAPVSALSSAETSAIASSIASFVPEPTE